jgi:hypothetical protein
MLIEAVAHTEHGKMALMGASFKKNEGCISG